MRDPRELPHPRARSVIGPDGVHLADRADPYRRVDGLPLKLTDQTELSTTPTPPSVAGGRLGSARGDEPAE